MCNGTLFSGFPRCCLGPLENCSEKGRTRAKRADFGRFPDRDGRHPLSPPFGLGEGKWGRKKYRRIPKCEGDEQGRVPKRSLHPKTLQNKRFGAPNFLGISPKLFAALRRIHPYLCTPVLPRGHLVHPHWQPKMSFFIVEKNVRGLKKLGLTPKVPQNS